MESDLIPEREVIPVGAYVRISDDEKDASGQLTREGVTRQEQDCRHLASELGLTVVQVYDDNDITAADERIQRPQFEKLLKDLESGVIQGFVFYHADRVARLELDAARVTRLYRLNPKLIGRSVAGGTDLSTDEGRAMFVMQSVMGGMEVSAVRRRTTRRNKDAASKGKDHGGKRPFGWNDDRKTLRKDEAELVRAAVRDITRGKTIATVRKEWIEAGVKPTAEGKGPLRDKVVRDRIINPRVCGYRIYLPHQDRREVTNLWLPDHVLYVDGLPVVGDWTPIVTPEEWRACVATLEERRRPREGFHSYSRESAKYLLSGIARCGECGARMYGKVDYASKKAGKEIHRYQCISREGGCGALKRVGPPVDEYVEELFLEAARRTHGAVQHEDIDDAIHDSRIAEIDAEIKEVMARRKPGHPKRISTSRAMDMISELEEERAQLTYDQRALTAAKIKRQEDTPSLLREWERYSIDMKRARLRRDIRAVFINRAPKGSRFNADLIDVDWVD
ncbi:recombinase family protein [Streptomyces sp. NPDC001982]|uniref:recombinase family protein n=1 Tax=Streptomyces sp. NPDC001982 TaxID=3154405 RepID=UPI00331A717F